MKSKKLFNLTALTIKALNVEMKWLASKKLNNLRDASSL